ncbi:unnamed protein product [Vicia faba]|uniref:Uncharacterized protein n=1 Tax=Vicia faba TaxID=3906 RepID=A0AAV0ZXY1_VICFA|nr:unnamed protein product [Vicia faba]
MCILVTKSSKTPTPHGGGISEVARLKLLSMVERRSRAQSCGVRGTVNGQCVWYDWNWKRTEGWQSCGGGSEIAVAEWCSSVWRRAADLGENRDSTIFFLNTNLQVENVSMLARYLVKILSQLFFFDHVDIGVPVSKKHNKGFLKSVEKLVDITCTKIKLKPGFDKKRVVAVEIMYSR